MIYVYNKTKQNKAQYNLDRKRFQSGNASKYEFLRWLVGLKLIRLEQKKASTLQCHKR